MVDLLIFSLGADIHVLLGFLVKHANARYFVCYSCTYISWHNIAFRVKSLKY